MDERIKPGCWVCILTTNHKGVFISSGSENSFVKVPEYVDSEKQFYWASYWVANEQLIFKSPPDEASMEVLSNTRSDHNAQRIKLIPKDPLDGLMEAIREALKPHIGHPVSYTLTIKGDSTARADNLDLDLALNSVVPLQISFSYSAGKDNG